MWEVGRKKRAREALSTATQKEYFDEYREPSEPIPADEAYWWSLAPDDLITSVRQKNIKHVAVKIMYAAIIKKFETHPKP